MTVWQENPAFELYDDSKFLLNAALIQEQQEFMKDETGSEQKKVTFEDLLVAVGKSRNKDAFIRLFEHFAPRIKSFLMKGSITAELADELAQETMLTVWQKADRYDPAKAAASTWIFTIARNKRIDFLRKKNPAGPNPQDPLLLADVREKPDETLSRIENTKILAEAIKDLPPEQADLIHKSFYEHKTHQDIAQETAIPLGTVKSRIRLALERLRRTLGNDPEALQ